MEQAVSERLVTGNSYDGRATKNDNSEGGPDVAPDEQTGRAEDHETEAIRQPLRDHDRCGATERRAVELA